jgi:nucleoside-diphosphate-sugar epimerase
MTERHQEHVLVAGATGLVGRAAVEHFTRAGYRVTAVSRRRPFDTYGAAFLSVDLGDPAACQAAFGSIRDVTRIVYAAVHEEQDLAAGWVTEGHVRRNGEMLRNMVDAVSEASPGLRHVAILQGPKAYGGHVKPMRPDSREIRDDMREVPNFYWVQQDYLEAKSKASSWTWTVLRPSLVVGEAVGGAMNLVAALGVYGAFLKAHGEPFHYPSAFISAFQPTDTDLMARALEWSGHTPAAANRIFNLTNGEVFVLKDLWPQIASALGMKPGDDQPCAFAETMPARAGEWDAIRERYSLRAPALGAFIGQSWQFLDFIFNLRPAAMPNLISTVAIRQAGFTEAMYSDDMLMKWFARYQQDKLLPPA